MTEQTQKRGFNKITIKQRIILLVSCPLIIILLSSVAIVYTVHHMGDTEPEEKPDPLIGTVLPADTDMSIEDFCAHMADEARSKSDIQAGTSVDVALYDFAGDFDGSVYRLIDNVNAQLCGNIKAKYGTQSVSYGQPCEKLLNIGAFAKESSQAQGEYHEDSREYRFVLTLPTDTPCIGTFLAEDKKVYQACKKEWAAYADITDDTVELQSVTARYSYDSVKGYITYFELCREYRLSAMSRFTGYTETLGSGRLTFGCRITTKYSIKHADVFIDEDELRLTKNGYTTLGLHANVAEEAMKGQDFTIELTSSDESIAKVDNNGLVEAVSISETPAVITARLTYLGNTYEDTCPVYITGQD